MMRVLALLVVVALVQAKLPNPPPADWKWAQENPDYGKANPVSYTPTNIQTQMKTLGKPYYPTCDWDAGKLRIWESVGLVSEWACAVQNNAKKDYLVRVKTTRPEGLTDDDGNNADYDHDFYYVVKAGHTIVANDGVGNMGGLSRCRICGVVDYTGPADITKFENLEPDSQKIQCRRECYATLFKHRNFNYLSRTVTADAHDVSSLQGISSIKVGGEGCKLIAYADKDFKNEICTFESDVDGDTAYDQRAVRQRCYDPNHCPSGHDCINSVRILATKYCVPGGAGGNFPQCPASKCDKPELNSITMEAQMAAMATPARSAKVQSLERLFKAMAAVLEE